MPQFQRTMLEFRIGDIRKKESKWIQELKALGISQGRVVHFGCAGGDETLALSCVLDACEIYGIDRDISRAKKSLSQLKDWIDESIQALSYTPISQEDRLWWQDVVPSVLKEERFPIFIKERDIAHPARPFRLPGNHFHLACCSNLLYRILKDQGEKDVKSAVEEMKRVVKLGGWIVADEPDNGAPECLSPIFQQARLELFKVEPYEFSPGKGVTTYYFRKRHEQR